jgi:hypothetical protein
MGPLSHPLLITHHPLPVLSPNTIFPSEELTLAFFVVIVPIMGVSMKIDFVTAGPYPSGLKYTRYNKHDLILILSQ